MRNQRGYTLLELSLTIGAGLVIGAIAIGVANSSGESAREKEAINQIHALIQIAGDRAGTGGVATNGIEQALIQSGNVPEGWIIRDGSTSAIRGAWGGTMAVDTVALFPGSAFADGIRINARAMPSPMCARLLMSTAAAVHESAVGGTVFRSPNGQLPVTRERASTVCTNSVAQTVTLVYAVR